MNQVMEKPARIQDIPEGQSIGAILLDMGRITVQEAARIVQFQKETGLRFGEAAEQLGLINGADIERVLARQFDYPYLPMGQGNYPKELVAAYAPFTRQVEALKRVRSQLMHRWFVRGHKSLPIVGIGAGDGASMFTANLAVVFSQLGQRTLVVDADLRSPSLGTIFNASGKTGLSEILSGRGKQVEPTVVEHFVDLSVLGAGTIPPNPQELLSRPSFKGLIGSVEHGYDCIFYDTTPMSKAGDALEIAAAAGCALVLIRKHHTKLAELEAVRHELHTSGIEVVGTVMIEF